MIKENNKPGFVKDIKALLRKTNTFEDIELTYGSLILEPTTEFGENVVMKTVYNEETKEKTQKLFKQIFTPSEKNLRCREYVRIKHGNHIAYACVEMDSYYWTLADILKVMKREKF